MIKNKKFRKKGVFHYENHFEPYLGVSWRAQNQEASKQVFYRWAKARVKNFRKDQKRKKKKYFEKFKSSFSLRKNGFF